MVFNAQCVKKTFASVLGRFFCFDHRFDLQKILPELGKMAMLILPMPYRLLKLAELSGNQVT